MNAPKWLIANDPHPAYSGLDLTDIPKVAVRMDEFPRLYSEPVRPTPPKGRVLPKTYDDDKAGFIGATVVLGIMVGALIVTVINLLVGVL